MNDTGSASTVAVAAPHPDAVDAATDAFEAGGNAIDAALAAAAVLTVVYPHQCSLGGDLIAVFHDARRGDGPAVAITSAGAAPAGIDVAGLRAGGSMPRQGPQTVTVPGVVAGWQTLAAMGAALPLRSALERARGVAAQPMMVSEGLARALASRRDAVLADDGLRRVFAPTGELVGAGQTVTQPALAATLEALVVDPSDFYRGPIAEKLVEFLAARGGAHTLDDFAGHETVVEPALEVAAGGGRWWAAPPPSQGALFLRLLSTVFGDGSHAELLDACIRAAEVRDLHLGDPRAGAVDVAALLGVGTAGGGGTVASADDSGDTVAITAADDQGRTVTLIQSVYQTFGAGIADPATGIVLHNRGAAFSLDPASPAALAPRSRPPHTLCPVIAATDGAVMALGCQGGRAQPWILAQLAADAVRADTDLGDLLGRGRWLIGAVEVGEPELTVVTEPGTDEVAAAADERGLPVRRHDARIDSAGHVQLVRRTDRPDGPRFDGASDPRADGSMVVVSGR